MKFNVYVRNDPAMVTQSFAAQVNQAFPGGSGGPITPPDAKPIAISIEADEFSVEDSHMLILLKDGLHIAAFPAGSWVYVYPASDEDSNNEE